MDKRVKQVKPLAAVSLPRSKVTDSFEDRLTEKYGTLWKASLPTESARHAR